MKRQQIDQEALVRGYVGGSSIRALCTETGLAYGTVHRRLINAGVSLRPRGGRIKASQAADQRSNDGDRNGGE